MTREVDVGAPLPGSRLSTRLAHLQEAASRTSAALPERTVQVTRIDAVAGGAGRSARPDSPARRAVSSPGRCRSCPDRARLRGWSLGRRRSSSPVRTRQRQAAVRTACICSSVRRRSPYFQADQTVLFAPDGSVQKAVGSVASVPPGDLSDQPAIPADQALRQALSFLQTEGENGASDPYGQPLPDGSRHLTCTSPLLGSESNDRHSTIRNA